MLKFIVFDPKNSTSYLYLAKIYNIKEDQKKEEKNLKATLLIEPNNEEAILMSMKIALEKSNYKEVKDLSKTFKQVCKKLCDENKDVLETLSNIEPNLFPQNFKHGLNIIFIVVQNILENTVIAYLPPGIYEDAYHNKDATCAHADTSVYR